jgi:hypothetical protein
MISLSNQLGDLPAALASKRDPGFSLIVAFDYYDGPERGLAVYPSGEGVRFSSLGDSQSRLFRAFELTAIKGSWWQQVRSLPEHDNVAPPVRVLIPRETSEALIKLEQDVLHATAMGHYIGVGSSNLEWLIVCSFPEEQFEAIRQLGGSVAGFRLVHQILKRQSQSRSAIVP